MEGEGEKIFKVDIEGQMKSAYIDYSMSVIVSRALPDVRDGMKPVHRRVLYGMHQLGLYYNKPHKKSARIVGEVLGKYHPHGDSSVYDAMVRMAQPWSMRYMLVDGQGNFGSIDGDSPAAMRYTEARMKRISEDMLVDIDKETVDHQMNFDDTLQEPTVLPTRIPNLLVNGASGIAVGMATNMPPHNLKEVIDGTIAYIDDNDIDIDGLMEYITAPDFPTGGIIYGYDGVKTAFHTGRGRVMVRGEAEIQDRPNSDKQQIVIHSIPYMVNKADMIKRTADLVNEKKIEGISDIRDESDRTGLRVVYELKRDAIPNVVLNKLYQNTALQTAFSVNNIALVNGRPMPLNLKDLIRHFVDHRHDVVVRRTEYELRQAEKRAHILEGLLVALDYLDEVIALIRNSRTPEEARNGLMEQFSLSEEQARAILDMRLQKLTGLERDKVKEEYNELKKTIEYLKRILSEYDLRMQIIKDELIEMQERYGDERKSRIEYAAEDFRIEDTIPNEQVVISFSHHGYLKRTVATEFRTQARGGKGAKGSSTKNEDFIESLYIANNHDYMLIFTESGRLFWLRVYEIPEGSKNSKGRPIQNLIQLGTDDKIKAVIKVEDLKDEEAIEGQFLMLSTEKGRVKKTPLKDYSRPRQSGINAITIKEDDKLLAVRRTSGNDDIMLATREGHAIRFHENDVRSMGRTASGVRGIRITGKDNFVIGMVCVNREENNDVLVVSENGYGKRSTLEDYRIITRGGKGVKTMNISEKTGKLIAIKNVTDEDDLMIITRNGLTIRLAIDQLRVLGRATQGVRLINLADSDSIAAVAKLEKPEETLEEDGQELPDEGQQTEPESDVDNADNEQ
ncbi:MAG: DNA gyrase subunit A [Bacteroidales bacterium]|nr:DNA gyrase subunit A [Bacteroidales bacterium]MCF8328422.1 DNA gyrase subunit A [Bacteroidales bacterium]